MDFAVDEDHKMVRQTVSRFSADVLGEHAEAWDAARRLPDETFQRLGELGLLGPTLPTQLGGSALDDVATLLAVEELARYDASTALAMTTHAVLAADLHTQLGDEDTARAIARGERVATMSAATRWQDGLPDSETLTISRVDADTWRLHGTVNDVVQCRSADIAVLLAQDVDGEVHVVFFDANVADVEVQPNDRPLGCRAADLGTWTFDRTDVPATAVATQHGDLSHDFLRAFFARADTFLAAIAVGVARGALEEGLDYANDREQFGRPISRFQVSQFKLADMTMGVDAARLSVLHAACTDANAAVRSRTRNLAHKTAMDVADEAVQLHGGYGYTSEYAVERYLRDARTIGSIFGTTHARVQTSNREMLAANSIFS